MLHLLLVLRKQFPMIVAREELWDLLGFFYWNYVLLWIHVHLNKEVCRECTFVLCGQKDLSEVPPHSPSLNPSQCRQHQLMWRKLELFWLVVERFLRTAALSPDCMRSPKIHIPLLLLGISSSASVSSARAFLAVSLVVGKLLVRTVSYSCL